MQHRTYIICLSLLLFLIQTPDWSYITQGLGFLGVFGVCLSVFSGSKSIKLNYISVFAGMFLVYLFASLLWSQIIYFSLSQITTYALLPVILLGVSACKDQFIDYRIFYKFLIILGLVIGFYAALQPYYQWGGLYSNISNHPFFNPNSLAVFMGVISVICLFFMGRAKEKCSIFILGISFIIAYAGMISTGSRGAIVVVIVTMLVMVLSFAFMDKKYLTKRGVIIGLFVLFVIVVVPMFLDILYGSTALFDSALTVYKDNNPRLLIWKSGIYAAMSTHPFIGNGIGTFKDIYVQFRNVNDRASGLHAHNDVLHLWVEIGMAGLVIIAMLAVGIISSFLRMLKGENIVMILPFSIILFCAGMAMFTPIILLPSLLLILAISISQISVCLKDKNIDFKWGNQFVVILLVVLSCLSLQRMVEAYFMVEVKKAINNGDVIEFLHNADKVGAVSMQTNVSVPIFRASSLLGIYDANILPLDKQSKALDEVMRYLNDAKYRNSYNLEALYYQGQVEKRKGNLSEAMNLWRKVIDIDPTYISARLELVENIDDESDAYELLKAGLKFKYWKQNPQKLYALTMVQAKSLNDKKTYDLSLSLIQKLFKRIK